MACFSTFSSWQRFFSFLFEFDFRYFFFAVVFAVVCCVFEFVFALRRSTIFSVFFSHFWVKNSRKILVGRIGIFLSIINKAQLKATKVGLLFWSGRSRDIFLPKKSENRAKQNLLLIYAKYVKSDFTPRGRIKMEMCSK